MNGQLIFLGTMIAVLAYLGVVDFKTLKIPNQFTIPLILGGLGINLSPWSICTFPESLLGAISGFGILYIINLLARILRYPDSIGMGDAKLLAGLGAVFGYACILPILFLAALACLLVHFIRKPKSSLSSIIAFGPYLCCAGIGFSIYQMMSFRI